MITHTDWSVKRIWFKSVSRLAGGKSPSITSGLLHCVVSCHPLVCLIYRRFRRRSSRRQSLVQWGIIRLSFDGGLSPNPRARGRNYDSASPSNWLGFWFRSFRPGAYGHRLHLEANFILHKKKLALRVGIIRPVAAQFFLTRLLSASDCCFPHRYSIPVWVGFVGIISILSVLVGDLVTLM